MAKLYGDEDFDRPVVERLRGLGHDVITAQEAGQAGRKVADDAVLAFATGQGRAVLTFNRRHFITLHRRTQAHAGIVACRRDPDVDALAVRIHQAITTSPTLIGVLLRVNRPPTP